jgi:hypothetical protein
MAPGGKGGGGEGVGEEEENEGVGETVDDEALDNELEVVV